MSRIGKLPISIPAGVTITHKDDIVTVKGPKGELSQYVNPAIKVTIEDGTLTMEENTEMMVDNPKQRHAFHGLYRALVNNMVVGVSEGYKKTLQLVVLVIVFPTLVMYWSSHSATHTPSCSRCPAKLKWKLSLRETRILSSCSNLATSSCSVWYVRRFARSASLSLIRARVSASRVKRSEESLVSQQVLNN